MNSLKLSAQKNKCLIKFLDVSRAFLSEAKSGDFSKLKHFYEHREITLTIIKLYNKKLEQVTQSAPAMNHSSSYIEELNQISCASANLIQEIFTTDLEIVPLIEEERSRLLSDLSQISWNEQIVKKFKSRWISESGEKLDGQL